MFPTSDEPMRSVLFHCKEYRSEFDSLATRPKDVTPEKINERVQNSQDCVVALINVEKGDDIKNSSIALAQEITQMGENVGRKNVVIVPFAHLSNKLAKSKDAIKALDIIQEMLEKQFNLTRVHFGSHKSLLLNVKGHQGNVRYREF